MAIIETNSLTRYFGQIVAVDNLNLTVEEGEIFGLIGPNGAGKTTTIKMLTTLLPPTSGRASIAGFDIRHQSAQVRKVIGYVPQLISADSTLSGYENLLIFAKLYDLPQSEREKRVRGALHFMGLDEVADKLVKNYSGGMIRRLEIAQSMLHRPRLLFLDEPTVGLDPAARRAVWEHIMDLRNQFGTTIFLTTHLMDEADELCTRVAIMHLGKVAAIGSPAELKKAVGRGEDVSLDEVFIHFTGNELDEGGNFRDVSRTRRVARRLG
ncbi:MAG: ATP-binding cassette domain-containing protein [Candidatus Saccharicenans sp.]